MYKRQPNPPEISFFAFTLVVDARFLTLKGSEKKSRVKRKADSAPLDTEEEIGSLESPGSPMKSLEVEVIRDIAIAAIIIILPALGLIFRPHEYAARPIARRAMKGEP